MKNSIKSYGEKAFQNYQASLQKDPNNAEILTRMGAILHDESKLDEAQGYFNRALAINPNQVEALGRLADILAYEGKIEASIPLFEKVLQISPDGPFASTAHFKLGVALSSKCLYEEGKTHIRKACELNSDPAHQKLCDGMIQKIDLRQGCNPH